MRFNIIPICGLLSIATQLVSGEPARAWDDPQNYIWYAASMGVCGYGAALCSTHGQIAAADTLATAAFCCTMVGAAAVANHNDQLRDAKAAFAKTKAKVGDAATFVKTKSGEYKTKAGVFVADCKEKFCKLVNKPRSPSPGPNRGSPRRRNYQRNQRRSGERKMKRSSPQNTRLRSRDPMSMEYYY